VGVNYLERRVGGEISQLESFPSYFEIETVNACNARCPMCTIDDWDRRDGLMSDDLFLKISQEIGEHKDTVKRVQLFRDGEPLLDKKLALRTAIMKGVGVKKVGISTNAALLTPARSRDILEAGMDEIILSIDSLTPSVYEKIRPPLKFDQVFGNILDFINIRNNIGSTCQAWVRMIRQESNKHEWPSFEDYWRGKLKDSDRVDYRNIHNWGSQLINFKQIAPANVEKPCVALWSLMVVFADGDVPRCNVDFNNRHPVGSLVDSSIAELWTSATQNSLRGKHLNGVREDICKGCTVWSEEANTEGERMAA
jgi:radical SAM protein with 4Fe4S-binding SPASM domain